MFDFNFLKKSVADLVGQVKANRRQIADLQALRARIESAPCSRDDFKARFGKYLDDQADKYLTTLAESFGFLQRHPGRLNDPEAIAKHLTLFGVVKHTKDVDTSRGFDGLVAALIPSMRKELFARIDAMPWPADALPLVGREQKIADIDQQLETLMQTERQLVDTASAAGIVIERA